MGIFEFSEPGRFANEVGKFNGSPKFPLFKFGSPELSGLGGGKFRPNGFKPGPNGPFPGVVGKVLGVPGKLGFKVGVVGKLRLLLGLDKGGLEDSVFLLRF